MTGQTPILGLTLPGGGTQNKYGPADVVDIDRINDNFSKLDSSVGIPTIARSAVTNPFLYQVIQDPTSVGGELFRWIGSGWVPALPTRLSPESLNSAFVQATDGAHFDFRYYTQDQLINQGALDGRYFTQGTSDGRYYSRGAIDNAFSQRDQNLSNGLSGRVQYQGSGQNARMTFGTGVTPTPSLDGTTNTYVATFNIDYSSMGFNQPPVVLITPQSADSGYVSVGVTGQPGNGNATGILRRRNNSATGYWWLAFSTI